MTWAEYYERYDGWQESTQYSRLASIKDFGPDGSPSEEICDCIQYVDTRTATSILRRALAAGVRFRAAEVAEIADSVRRHIVGGANRTLFSVDLPPRLCRTGT